MSFDQYWILVLLAFSRTLSFIFFLPFFRGFGFPQMTKVTVSLGISLLVATRMQPVAIDNMLQFSGMLLLEFIVGLVLAYIVEIMVTTVRIAGSLIDIDMGISSPFMDMDQTQTTIMSSLFYYMFVLIFLVTDGFDDMFAGFIYSFKLDIAHQLLFGGNLMNFILETFTYMFFGGLQIALPFMMASFLINLAMLLMSKSVDKINILANVFGIKILVGISLILVSVPVLIIAFQQLNENLSEKFLEVMNYMFTRNS